MPTGYTAAIKDGVEFKDFALQCARNFGALIMMRDEPSDAVIPDEFLPSEYSKNALQKAKEHFAKLNDLTQKGWEHLQDEEFNKSIVRYEEARAKEFSLLDKYNAMLIEVYSWVPPTTDHTGLKEFMIEQIESSIKFDCNYYSKESKRPVKQPLDEFISDKTKAALRDIKYHNDAWASEQERTDSRNKWVADLRKSLQ